MADATWLRANGYREPAEPDAIDSKVWRSIKRVGDDRYLCIQDAGAVPVHLKNTINQQAADLLDGCRVPGDALLVNEAVMVAREHKTNRSRVEHMQRVGRLDNAPPFLKQAADDFESFTSVVLEPHAEGLTAVADVMLPLGRGIMPAVTEPMTFNRMLIGGGFCTAVYVTPTAVFGMVVDDAVIGMALDGTADPKHDAPVQFTLLQANGEWSEAPGGAQPLMDRTRWGALRLLAWVERYRSERRVVDHGYEIDVLPDEGTR